jgi:hypothetical protein
MRARPSSSTWVAAAAIEEAEAALERLPLTAEVRAAHARTLALKSVLLGAVHDTPALTLAQRQRLTADARAMREQVRGLRVALSPDHPGDEER